MPYVDSEARRRLFGQVVNVAEQLRSPGELNYSGTILAQSEVDRRGGNYAAMASVFGDMICCMLELYRRRAAPYEDRKISENGDVAWQRPTSWE